jgi:TetR/AcrR family transcriptional regulator, transcriptional repressor for nem operon
MIRHTAERPKLTAKGELARTRIVAASARLIHERGVAGTTLEDVKAAADVSGSQLYHYFPDKDDLVRAVIDYQTDAIVSNQRQADLGSARGLRAWRDMLIKMARTTKAQGGCPLGSLGGQLAETDPESRALIAEGFERWSEAIRDGLRALSAAGLIRADIDPDDLAITLLATLQGGLLLSQLQRTALPLERAVDTVLGLACGS